MHALFLQAMVFVKKSCKNIYNLFDKKKKKKKKRLL